MPMFVSKQRSDFEQKISMLEQSLVFTKDKQVRAVIASANANVCVEAAQ